MGDIHQENHFDLKKVWSKCLLHVFGHYPLLSSPHASKEKIFLPPKSLVLYVQPAYPSIRYHFLNSDSIYILPCTRDKWRPVLATTVVSSPHLHGWWHHLHYMEYCIRVSCFWPSNPNFMISSLVTYIYGWYIADK